MLLERQAELAAIDAALAGAVAGAGRVALLLGPPGLGKTSLLNAAAASAGERGMQVLRARGGELEREVPFDLARQCFRPSIRRLSAGEQAAVLTGAATHARGLVAGGADEGSTGADPQAVRLSLDWLAMNLAEARPLLIAIDDLHWADDETARWLGRFAGIVGDLPICLVAAARPAEPGGHAVVGALTADERVETLPLAPLGAGAVSELVRAQVGAEAETGFVAACGRATGGNPYFLRELLRALRADAVRPIDAEIQRVLRSGPTEVARSILVRLARHGDAARRLAVAVAVLGGEAELRLVAELSGLSIDDALPLWDVLVRSEVLAPGQPLDFIHPIARTAVYGDLGAGALSREHRHAAEILDRDGAEPQTIGMHAAECEPAGDSVVLSWLRAAAAAADRAGAPEAAARSLHRALAEPPPSELRTRVQFELGMTLVGIDSIAAAAAFAAAATAEAPAADRLLALRWRGRALAYAGRMATADGSFAEAVALAGDSEERLLLEATRDFYALWWSEAPQPAARSESLRYRAEPLRGRTAGERRALAVAALSLAMSQGADATAVTELADRARAHMPAWLDRDEGAETANAIGDAGILCDEPRGLADLEGAVRASTRRGWSMNAAFGRYQAAMIRFRLGDLVAAEVDGRLAWETLSRMRDAAATLYWWAASGLATILIARGWIDEAAELVEASGLASEQPEVVIYPWPGVLRGELALAQGQVTEGIEILLAAGAWLEERGFKNPSFAPWRALAAPALAASGRSEEARTVVAPALRHAQAFGSPWALGMALRAAGTATPGPEGLNLYREAMTVLDKAGCRLELARARLELGSTLRRANRRADAREHLRIALDLAHRCGARELGRVAQIELAATGARQRRVMLSGVESLTPSERRVAELAAGGMSNPEIAQILFVTRKTVEAHLGHVYQKLDLDSRGALTAALA